MANGGTVSQATIDTLTKLVTQLGFPIVVAGILLWFILGSFKTSVDQISLRMAENAGAIEAVVKSNDEQMVELRAQTQIMRETLTFLENRGARQAP